MSGNLQAGIGAALGAAAQAVASGGSAQAAGKVALGQLASSGAFPGGKAGASAVGQGMQCTSGETLELEISAEGLKDKDLIGRSDPICIVETKELGKWKELGRTESVKDDLNPHWSTRVSVQYCFQMRQDIRFRVIDKDGKGDSDDDLGQVIAPLGDMLVAAVTSFRMKHNPKKFIKAATEKKLGTLTVRVHRRDQEAGRAFVQVALRATGLDRADGPLSKSDPYFVIDQIVGTGPGGKSRLCKSEVKKNTQSPTWRPQSFYVDTYGQPLSQIQLVVSLIDHDDSSQHDPLGDAYCSLASMRSMATFDVINEKKRAKKGSKYKNSGELIVTSITTTTLMPFVSFLTGGCRLRFACAVDFTASNGHLNTPGTLHYSDGVTPSVYQQALAAVGSVVSPYLAQDRCFEAYGFGAKHPASQSVRFDFPLNLHGGEDPRVVGVEGLVQAYSNAVHQVGFAGPTNFSPVLSRVMQTSAYPTLPTQQAQHYTIMLILTDGQCTDMQQTIDTIIQCSQNNPMSIVIVGVGNADFSGMEMLDGDNAKLTNASGRSVERDIVQFVRWDPRLSAEQLAAQVLREVPSAVSTYFGVRGIQPNTPISHYAHQY